MLSKRSSHSQLNTDLAVDRTEPGHFADGCATLRARDAVAYDVDGVPSLGIHGRFYTHAGMAGTRQRTLEVTDALVRRCREGR